VVYEIGKSVKKYPDIAYCIPHYNPTDRTQGELMCPVYFQNKSEFQQAPNYNNDIAGWMEPSGLKWLYLVAQEMNNIIEVGSWKGRSTDALLAGCRGTVWAVDHFKGSKTERHSCHKEATQRDISKIFLENVGHYKNLKLLKMDSLEAAKRFKDKSIDMVFIDGGHTDEEVKADIKAWLPKVKKLICGHDYGRGIEHAIHEVLGNVNALDSIWIKPIKEIS